MAVIKTYQDLLAVGASNQARAKFIVDAITEHESGAAYSIAKSAKLYAEGKNETITTYRKLLYTVSGKTIPDNFSANHKCASGFFRRFVTQEAAYLLGNGVTFENEKTKEKLGANFDEVLYSAGKAALVQGVCFGFFNNGKIEVYGLTEFVPLYDEEDGALKAGIRYWQLAENKPLRATLFELDGYTDFIKRKTEQMTVKVEKRNYREIVKNSVIDGERIYSGDNYGAFPIVPLWANSEKQSELVGRREQIDCYDLIKSGFANDLDDASAIYWTITNAGGMDDISLAEFVQRMKTVKAAVVDNDTGTQAQAHTVDVPYQGREAYLSRLEKDLYKDFMALDSEQIAAGNVTATQIQAAYEPLNQKTDEFEMCVIAFLRGLLSIAGVEGETPTFKRSQIVNQKEIVEMMMLAAEYLDEETMLRHLPFLSVDEVQGVIDRKARETADMFDAEEQAEEEAAE